VELELLVATSRALAESGDVEHALQLTLDLVCRHTGWPVGHAYLRHDDGVLRPSDRWHLARPELEPFRVATTNRPFAAGQGLPGRAFELGHALWIQTFDDPDFPRVEAARATGLRSGIALPVRAGAEITAIVEFFATTDDPPSEELVTVLDTVALQLGRAWRRQTAEAALATSEERFRSVTETAHDSIVTADLEGRVTYANAAAARMFGRPAEALVGRNLVELMPERFRAAHRAGLQRYLSTGTPRVMGSVVEVAGLRADGTEFPLELSLAHGRAAGEQFFTGVLRDITERQRTEQFLARTLRREEQASAELHSLEAMKSSFLTAVSHEMRTPLASVLGIALTLDRKSDLPAAAQRELVRQLADNARRLDSLLEDLLDVDRMTRGVVELRRSEEDLGALIRRIVGNAGLTGRAVSVDVADEPLVVAVDVPKVERVLEHLLSNVVRHTPPDTPVWVSADRTANGVLLRVEDAGPGLPEELRAAVFEPFRQGPTLHPHSPGTGLGLALVQRFAELHGGRAWIEPGPRGGATVHVLLAAA
jgi:PAS domain S-box-containing protein